MQRYSRSDRCANVTRTQATAAVHNDFQEQLSAVRNKQRAKYYRQRKPLPLNSVQVQRVPQAGSDKDLSLSALLSQRCNTVFSEGGIQGPQAEGSRLPRPNPSVLTGMYGKYCTKQGQTFY